MAQLEDKSGIRCDLCACTYHQQFTYYSFDFRRLSGPVSFFDVRNCDVSKSLDVCMKCFTGLTPDIIKYGHLSMSDFCGLTGMKLSGERYYLIIDKVSVCVGSPPQVQFRFLECALSMAKFDDLCAGIKDSDWSSSS